MKKIFYNCRAVTMDRDLPRAEAFSVERGRITGVGSSEEMLRRAVTGDRKYDLEGTMVIPAITDAHTHLYLHACARRWADLTRVRSAGDIIDIIISRREAGPDNWILGRGWDQNRMADPTLPSLESIDRASGSIPIFLERICGHAALVNSAALRIAGMPPGTPDPPGGRVSRKDGLVIDEAVNRVRAVIETPSPGERKKFILEAVDELLSLGIGGVHDMGMTEEALRLYRELSGEGDLRIRIAGYLPGTGVTPDDAAATGRENEFLSVPGVKLFADGSLGARSAALLDDYSDDPGNRGILVTEPGELKHLIRSFHNSGVQVSVHAIGDRANRILLDIFENVLGDPPTVDRRHRIEHAQLISREDLPRFARLGIVASVQFIHCVSDMPWVSERIGKKRLHKAYPWRSLADSGCVIAAGSDLPFENQVDPFSGLLAATARTGRAGKPEGGWMPEERISLPRALEAYTTGPAFASFDESRRGRLGAGMDADFIILSRDLFGIPEESIPYVDVLATFIAGRAVYLSGGCGLEF